MHAEAGSTAPTLTFLVSLDDTTTIVGDKAIFGRRDEPALCQVPLAALKAQLQETVGSLGELFQELAAHTDGISLKEVQIGFEVTAAGKVALLGTSLQSGGKGAITLTFGR
ncbi:hypothetical protein AB0J85_02985 [Micromonospora echinofusca]|uniref:Pepco domain-containing protein n=1 Tax=Micromonospora echinofusca TaxID=47858 RepID=UPI003427A74D